jgi:hypothetical protein
MSLREVIHLMQLLEDSQEVLKWAINEKKPTVHCKVFEDNSGALEMARLPKMRPRSKHLCIRLHHFREHVRQGKISINKIPTRYQLGDIATKPQPEDLFVSQRESIMQWDAEFATVDDLKLPAHHLRACDISEDSEALCMSQQDVANKPEIGTEKTETDVRPVLGILRETSEETHPMYPTQDQSEQLGDFNNGSEASSRHDSNLHGNSTVVSDTMK